MLEPEYIKGMLRVVDYLKERANVIEKAVEFSSSPNFKRTHQLKALALREAAYMIEQGIERSKL